MTWNEAEKSIIRQYVAGATNGILNWHKCAVRIGTKTSRQCYDFFALQFHETTQNKPARHKWTEEECKLISSYDANKQKWTDFRDQHFPNLTLSQLKNQYQRIQYLEE